MQDRRVERDEDQADAEHRQDDPAVGPTGGGTQPLPGGRGPDPGRVRPRHACTSQVIPRARRTSVLWSHGGWCAVRRPTGSGIDTRVNGQRTRVRLPVTWSSSHPGGGPGVACATPSATLLSPCTRALTARGFRTPRSPALEGHMAGSTDNHACGRSWISPGRARTGRLRGGPVARADRARGVGRGGRQQPAHAAVGPLGLALVLPHRR